MLFTIIRRNEKLAAKRSPMFDKNRFAKFLIYFMVAYWAALLLLMGVTLPSAFESAAPSMEMRICPYTAEKDRCLRQRILSLQNQLKS